MSKPKKWDSMTKEQQDLWKAKKAAEHRKWAQNNPDKAKKWASENKEKVNRYNAEMYKKNPVPFKLRTKRCQDIVRRELKDSYIADLLGFTSKTIKNFPDLIEAKREQIKIQRELKPKTRKKKQNAQESK